MVGLGCPPVSVLARTVTKSNKLKSHLRNTSRRPLLRAPAPPRPLSLTVLLVYPRRYPVAVWRSRVLDDASKAFELEASCRTATETVLEASRVSEEQMDDSFTRSDMGKRPSLALAS